MPDQPTTEAQVAPQVSPTSDLPMDVTPDALGAGVGQAIQGAGDVAHRIHVQAVERANQAAVLDADNQTNAFLTNRLYDAKTGVLHQQLGTDAPAAVDQALADFDKHTTAVSGQLTNDNQRLAYQRMIANRRFDLQRQLGVYEHGEVSRAEEETRNAAIAWRTTAAVQNAGKDPDLAIQNMLEGKAIIADDGRGKHQSDDVIRERQAEFASATHLGVLEQLVATGQDRTASAWYDAHKDELTGRAGAAAARLVEAGSTAGEAMRTADSLVYNALGEVRPRDEIDQDVRGITDPKLRDAVQTRVDRALDLHTQEVAEKRRDDLEAAYAVLHDPGNELGPYDPHFIAMTANLRPRDREELAASWQKRVDPIKVDNEMRLAASDPDAFLGRMRDDGPSLLTDLGPQAYGKLQEAEKEIRAKGQLGNGSEILTKATVVDGALVAAGFKTVAPRSGTVSVNREAPGAAEFLTVLDANIQSEAKAKGRALTPPEMRDIADRTVIESTVQPAGSLWGLKAAKPISALTPEERDRAARSLADYAKQSPAAATEAVQAKADFGVLAGKLGFAGDLTDDQMDRAMAQRLIMRERDAAGDQAGKARAKARMQAILIERKPTAAEQALNARRAMDRLNRTIYRPDG